jgi:hypothetical protein
VGGDPPDVPRRVLYSCGPVPVKLGCRHLFGGSTRVQAPSVYMINIVNVKVQLARYGTVSSSRISHHDDRTANLDLGMTHVSFPVIDQRPLFRIEHVFQEIDQSWDSVHDQVWSNRSIVFRNRFDFASDRLHCFLSYTPLRVKNCCDSRVTFLTSQRLYNSFDCCEFELRFLFAGEVWIRNRQCNSGLTERLHISTQFIIVRIC